MTKRLFSIIVALILALGASQPAYASGGTDTTDFGSCVNPQWSLTQENVGNDHGVVGIGTFAGTDKIYASGNNALQCLCVDSGKGYETKWLDASGLTESEINVYKKEGWIFVGSGSSWGLKDVPYLAKNSEYSCKGETTPTPSKPSVISLASTGNEAFIYFLILLGGASLIAGMTLGFRKK